MMSRKMFLFLALGMMFQLAAAETVALPKPSVSGTATLGEALKMRRTVRDFTPIPQNELPQIAADLLWCACGINRDGGKKVIPAALARYAVSVYFADRRAVYLFDAAENRLLPVADENVLPYCASNREICDKASAALLLVIDESVWGKERGNYAALEAGAMMQNVYLYCAASGLGTVACGSFNDGALRKILRLENGKTIFLAMPVGRAGIRR